MAPLTVDRLQQLVAARKAAVVEEPAIVEMVARPTIRERAEVILAGVGSDHWTDLREVLGDDLSAAVATFLAVLILVRRGWLAVGNTDPYARVAIRRLVDVADLTAPLDE